MTRIIPRAEWGARFANGSGAAPLPARGVYLHHSVTAAVDGPGPIRALEEIGQSRFGAGVSYTFIVGPDGQVYEGHGIDRIGAHTRGLNLSHRAICLLGNFEIDDPTRQALDSIVWLVRHGASQGWWPATITGGHRDAPGAATACPGSKLYARIPELRQRIATGDDMTVPQWAQRAWKWATDRKVVDGTRPNDPVTRAEMVTILHRILEAEGKAPGWVEWPPREVMSRDRPNALATRAEVATGLAKLRRLR
jgi:hypothetical protein